MFYILELCGGAIFCSMTFCKSFATSGCDRSLTSTYALETERYTLFYHPILSFLPELARDNVDKVVLIGNTRMMELCRHEDDQSV